MSLLRIFQLSKIVLHPLGLYRARVCVCGVGVWVGGWVGEWLHLLHSYACTIFDVCTMC